MAMFLTTACSSPAKGYPVSDHYDGKRFFNPGVKDEARGIMDLVRWRLGSSRKDWPDRLESKAQPKLATSVPRGEVHATFVNHATHLLQFETANVITDPVFSERASPVQWAGPKRHCDPGIAMEQLPKIDVVVVSHNHYDHMDIHSLKTLAEKFSPVILVPLGNKPYLEGIPNVHELDWWESYDLPGKTKITLVPAQHWSRRKMFDRNEALWGGYMIESSGVQTFFAGDTGYGPHFTKISEKFPHIDLAIIPIGAYEPRWFMKPQHMNPEEAVQTAVDISAKKSLGTHYGCFRLTDEAPDDPVKDLKTALDKLNREGINFEAPETGTTTVIKATEVRVDQKKK